MNTKLNLTFASHFLELKRRLLYVIIFLFVSSLIGYFFSKDIYLFITEPLSEVSGFAQYKRHIIYTGLAEVFFAYIKIACFSGFLLTFPFLAYQLYSFISPGLLVSEKRLIRLIFISAPFLFYLGGAFMFFFVIPKAWSFFINFEIRDAVMPLVLEARISEYISLVIQLILAFGLAFELPIFILVLTIMKLFNSRMLVEYRRYAIVFIFIFAGIVTPPDIISQIALAIPMILLYEISLTLCKIVEE